MRSPERVRLGVGSLLLLAALAVAPVTGGLTAGAGPALGATTTTVPDAATVRAQARALPGTTVVDLADGKRLRLRTVSRGRPIVLWFWAPG